MKTTKYIIVAVVGALLTLTACVNDLESYPINEQDKVAETVYDNTEESYLKGLAKLYNTMSSHSVAYVTVKDEGASQVLRAFFACQEITTDACKIAWGDDAWCRAMNTNTWTDEENDAVFGIFFRSIQAISYCNEFLRQTTDDKLASRDVPADVKARVKEFRAEARVIRAWYYWMAIDVFGDVPFTTEKDAVGTEAPAQAPRAEIYDYIVAELEELASDDSALPAAQSNYPRVDKGAALGLLSRLYLNAETYKGEPEWEKCKQTCERIFALGYKLADDYAELFRGDNGENPDAKGEFIMAVPFDTLKQQSYGGTTFLTCAAISSNDITTCGMINGNKDGWGGIRISGHYVTKYFNVRDVDFETGEYTCDDNRGKMFFIKGHKGNGDIPTKNEIYNFEYGWSCHKFSDVPHDTTWDKFTKQVKTFSNIDYPIIRLGEIYLTYAEACVRLGQGATAQSKMDELAVRTGVPALSLPASWDNAARDMFVAERARELLWESCRRTDLIRYGLYSGDEYLWPYKGGESASGQSFPEYKELFAIPASQIEANPDLYNPEGYGQETEE